MDALISFTHSQRTCNYQDQALGEKRAASEKAAVRSNQTELLCCIRRVTTGHNEDVGRVAFFRFLHATSTHRYALTTNSFPVCASSRKRAPLLGSGLIVLVLYLRDNFKNHGLQVAHVNLTFAGPSGPALTASRFVRPCQLRVVLAHPSKSMAVGAMLVDHAACLNSRKASIARFERTSLRSSR